MSSWVSTALEELGIVAPEGFVYQGHSARSGGSSAAEAISVSRFRGDWLGGWSQTGRTRELHCIDLSVRPTAGAYALFGWLLESCFSTELGSWVRWREARATDNPGEPA
jgi:hypothetical protein